MKLERQRVTQSSHDNTHFLSFTANPQNIFYTIQPRNTRTQIPAPRSKCIINKGYDIDVPDSLSVDSCIPIPVPRCNAGIISQPLYKIVYNCIHICTDTTNTPYKYI